MSDRTRHIKDIPTNRPPTVIEVKVRHFPKSWNRVGYYALSAIPVEKGPHFKTFTLFSGASKIVEQADRFNAKKLASIQVSEADISELVAKVIAQDKSGLAVAE
jgi:hypothetical protein